jgi:hypothetical protein
MAVAIGLVLATKTPRSRLRGERSTGLGDESPDYCFGRQADSHKNPEASSPAEPPAFGDFLEFFSRRATLVVLGA